MPIPGGNPRFLENYPTIGQNGGSFAGPESLLSENRIGEFQGIKMISVAMEFESGVHNKLLQSGVRWLKNHMKMQSVEFSLYIKKLLTWLLSTHTY